MTWRPIVHRRRAIYAVLVCLVLVVLTVTVFFARSISLEKREYLLQNDAVAKGVAATIQARLEGHLSVVRAYANRFRFREDVKRMDRTAALVHLRQLQKDFPELDRVFLADPAGIVWATVPEAPETYGRSYAHRDWYKGVSREWRPYLSEVYETALSHALAIALAVPIRDQDGTVIGILASVQRLETLRQWLLPIEVPGGDLFVVDRTGRLLFHRTRVGPEHLADYAEIPAVRRLLQGVNGLAELENPVDGVVSLSAYRWLPSLGWGVVVQRADNVALRRTRTLVLVSAVGLLLFTAALAILGIVAIRNERRTANAHARLEVEIVERRRAEEEAAAASRAKSEFLSRMSHELRTPLNGILGFAQLLELDAHSPEQREGLEHILKGGRHLLALINEVLDIARIEAGKLSISLEPVPAGDVINSALDLVRPLAAARGIRLPAAIACDRHVMAVRQRLQQVLLNLLSNAVKYNRKGGAASVSWEAAPHGRFRLTVADTGPGIAPDRIHRLFTPFDRLDAQEEGGVEGTGLGLALSKGLVELMGGSLRAESTLGQGSRFIVELPRAESPTRELERARATIALETDTPGVHGTVLYIEDNLSNLRLVERIVTRRPGVTLLSAMQGSRGLELAQAHRPDLIVLDLHLPDMPGQEVLAHLRADSDTREIPVVILSADATPSQVSRVLQQGAHAYLTKPLVVTQFLTLLDELLARAVR